MGSRRARAVKENQNAKLVCVVDDDFKNASYLACELNCDFYTDYDKALKRHDVDCVVIAVPNKLHSEISIEAIREGKHVFCEKPMAIKPEECELMVNEALKHNVYLKVSSNIRYFGNIRKAKELLDQRVIGDLLFMRGWIGHRGWNLKPNSWFIDPDLIGGGTLLDNGCHLIDLVRWFMGEIKECIGFYTTGLHKQLPKRLEDTAMGILITIDNKPIFIQSSWAEINGYLYAEVYGERGAIYVDNRGNNAKTILLDDSGLSHMFDYSDEPRISFKLEIDDFIDSVIHGIHPTPTGYDGMRVIQIIHGIYESAKRDYKVKVFNENKLNPIRKEIVKRHGEIVW